MRELGDWEDLVFTGFVRLKETMLVLLVTWRKSPKKVSG